MKRLMGYYFGTTIYGAINGLFLVGALILGLDDVAGVWLGFSVVSLMYMAHRADSYFQQYLDWRYGPETDAR